jgi:hypothetical protein
LAEFGKGILPGSPHRLIGQAHSSRRLLSSPFFERFANANSRFDS